MKVMNTGMKTNPPRRVTVAYRGRIYKLLWWGATRFGRRAHLQFRNGSKDFWVNADACKLWRPPAAPERQVPQVAVWEKQDV